MKCQSTEDIRQLTELCFEGEVMPSTEYGRITYGEWCEREAERINQTSLTVAVERPGLGLCCLTRVAP